MSRTRLALMLGAAIPLAACGADEIVSPGTGGNIIINNPPAPAPTPSPSPTPTPTPTVTAAAGCPTIADPAGLTNEGTVTSPGTGTFRICTLPARITVNTTLPRITGLLYRLPGRVDVGNDLGPSTGTGVTLTIDPGVIIYGSGVAWMHVNRGNRISAIGTATQPIIFTSSDNVTGLNTNNSIGQWGGLVLSGRAQITDCRTTGATPGTINCERQVEGAVEPALYGGATNTDNSGTLSFVQLRFSGFVLSGNSELQSLTTGGTGRGTQLSRIMSFNSSDDGSEYFGGRVNMRYYVAVGADDDSLDTDTGVKMNLQYALMVQRPSSGDSIIEADSDTDFDEQTPRQNTIVSNMTAIHRSTGGNNAAILLRGGTDYQIYNSIVTSSLACLRVSRPITIRAAAGAPAGSDENGPPVFRSVLFNCAAPAGPFIGSSGVTAADVAALFGSGTNNNNQNYTPTLTNVFVPGANETAVSFTNAASLQADPETPATVFFEAAANYVGAFRDANDRWFQGWVCNSTTVDFGLANTTGACTSIPAF